MRLGLQSFVLACVLSLAPIAGLPQTGDTEAERLSAGVQRGDPGSMFSLGYSYCYGMNGVRRDYELGVALMRGAAERGHTEAQWRLGQSYFYGHFGLSINYAEALYWNGLAARSGVAAAQVMLAEAYLNGRGVEMDLDIAENWAKLAAAQGNFVGQELVDFIPRHRRALAGQTGRDAVALVTLLLASLAAQDSAYQHRIATADLDWSKPAVAACRADTEKAITECWTEQEDCDGNGCWDHVVCDRRLSACNNHSAGPYGQGGRFYCDTRNLRNFDFDREIVIREACLHLAND